MMNTEAFRHSNNVTEARVDDLTPRHLAHRSFDTLWESHPELSDDERRRLLAKSHAYRLLALELGIVAEEEINLRGLPIELIKRVPEAVARIKRMLASRTETQIDYDYRQRGEEISLARKGLGGK
jgi:hypothetical protein